MTRNRIILLTTSLILLSSLITGINPLTAAEPQVRAILFFSPTCGHCEKVINDVLPPLQAQYNQKLLIVNIDVTQPSGQQLYVDAHTQYGIKPHGVPALFIGENVLFGSVEIPEKLPGLIQNGLESGGINWPAIPGLADFLAGILPENVASGQLLATSAPQQSSTSPNSPAWLQRFQRDPLANSLAVLMLVVMLASLVWIGYAFLKPLPAATGRWPVWVIPLLAVFGTGVAIYLTYVETSGTAAICGPVGDCNSVQQSPYARVWGIIPVGLIGLAGYIAILAAWIVQTRGPARWRPAASVALWSFALFGVIFTIYLTFLEPFVIGATCMWCLTSALFITLILWASSAPAIQVWEPEEPY